MGWFEEQLQQRAKADENVITESFSQIAGAVMGKRMTAALNDDRIVTEDAIGQILNFYRVEAGEVPSELEDMNEVLEYLMRPHGIMRRTVNLERGWYKDAAGAMLGTLREDGSVVALMPTLYAGYKYYDRKQEKYVRINSRNEDLLDHEAIAFYKPFPLKKMDIGTLFRYICEQIRPIDVVVIGIIMLVITLVGMLVPRVNSLLLTDVLKSKNAMVLTGAGIYLFGVMLSGVMYGVARTLATSRINTRLSVNVQAASMMRVLSMPVSFFRDYNSGELSDRLGYINNLSDQLVGLAFNTTLGSLFSLLYIFQIFKYAPGLVAPAMLITLLTILVTVSTLFLQMRVSKQRMLLGTKENGISYALISGIQKIRLAGAENRAFGRWGKAYAQQASITFNPPLLLKISAVLTTAISLVGMIVMYFFAVRTNVSVADYYAFNASYGMVSTAFFALAGIVTSVAQIKPTLEMIKPFFETEPEVSEEKEVITSLKGGIEINNVTFRYEEGTPPVLDDLSLKIRPGQYVAVVGKTGCGKSTLVRLLLGFETPQRGAIYYDGKDLKRIDQRSLRRKIGTVMQNGKLFLGDVYSNIVISAPQLTLDDAWEAAEVAGIAEDIRQMPMGMNTLISEGQGGISGGQKQRLMIARAIAPKPKILIFDEATSALDNLTQKQVSQALDAMNCTRIVIAHRLSTIKQCDRIIVLEGGKIIEDGTYEELISNNGFFAELVSRQRLEESSLQQES